MEAIIYLNMVQMERNHWWYKGRREIISKISTPYLRPNVKMLDAGCGAGGTMEYMEKHGSIVGVDISEEMVEHCRKVGLQVKCSSLLNLPFEDNQFDLVFCLDVLEHLPDDLAALKELKRILRPGGCVIISVPAFNWLWGRHDELNNHQRRYRRRELAGTIKESGLNMERSSYFNFFLLPPVFFMRQISKFLDLKKGSTDFSYGTGALNLLLYNILQLEASLLDFLNFPVGVSQIAVAKKN